MLVLSKLTNINHANGGSYDPPLFLYSALFAARGRGLAGLPRTAAGFGGVSPHGGALAGLPRTAAGFGGASPHGGGLWRVSPLGGGLWRVSPLGCGLWRVAPHGGGLWRVAPHGGKLWRVAPHSGGLWRGFPARLSLPPRYIRLGAGSFFAVFRIRARHTAKASAKILPVTLPYFILHRKIQEVC